MIVKLEGGSTYQPENGQAKEVSAAIRGHYARQYSISVAKKINLPAFEIIVKTLNHRLVSDEELEGRSNAVSGEYRTRQVFMPKAPVTPAQPETIPDLMDKMGKRVDAKMKSLNHKKVIGLEIDNILDNMSFTHYWLTRIHPFREGNGRTAREINAMLSLRTGLPVIILGPVDKDEYLSVLNNIHFNTYLTDKFEANLDSLTLFLARKMKRSFPAKNLSPQQQLQIEKIDKIVNGLNSSVEVQ
jgi:Fic family protein